MPGKLCDPRPAVTRAYCEGRKAAKDGAAVGTNPHALNSDSYDAWNFGHISWGADPATGEPQGRDCCATPFGGGFVG